MTDAILPFTIDLYEEVIALWQESEGIGLSEADSKEGIRFYLERNPGMSFVTKDQEGAILGAILCGHDGRRGYIHHLAVRQGFRRQGTGRRLVQECLSRLKAIGIQKCHIFIFPDNQNGIKFWMSMGWTFREDLRVISKNI
ncbi:MAG: GNAT family N-acetyltransferase [Thermodesulfobacteriota bacterium]